MTGRDGHRRAHAGCGRPELVISTQTAKAIGVKVSTLVLVRVDEIQ